MEVLTLSGNKKDRLTPKQVKDLVYGEEAKNCWSSESNTNARGVLYRNNRWYDQGGQCHAWTNDIPNDSKIVIGNCSGTFFKKEEAQHFLSWLFDPERSYYSKLIKYYGDDFHILYNGKDSKVIKGFYISNYNHYTHNHQVLHGLFKATRMVYEHRGRMSFYKKWAMKEGYDPIIVWPLCYYFLNGEKSKATHCSFDNPEFNLENHVNINHDNWDPSKKRTSYGGESNAVIGKGFTPYEHILAKGFKPVKSTFYSLYNTKNVKVFNDEAFHNFFKEWNTSRYKEYHKCVA